MVLILEAVPMKREITEAGKCLVHCDSLMEDHNKTNPRYMKLSYILEQSPRLEDNYASKCSSDNFPHTKRHHAWKTVRTTWQFNVVLQLRGEVMKSRKTVFHAW